MDQVSSKSAADTTNRASGPQLICDKTEAARFLVALDHRAAHHTFQTFDDNADIKSPKLASVFNGTLQKNWIQLTDLSSRGAGVFITVNETNLRGREASDIVRVRTLFVDLDGASLDVIKNDTEVPQPHITVESSPNHWHVYWLVNNVPLGAFRRLQQFLIKRFGGDPKVHDLPRVLRLPGFPHQKIKHGVVSTPFLSRIESINKAAPYDVEIFASLMASAAPFNDSDDNTVDGIEPYINDDATDETKLAVIKSKYADVDQEKIQAALDCVSADCSYDDWRDIGAVICHSGLGIEVFDNWSATAKGVYSERSTAVQWKACRKMWQIGPATLYRFADQQRPGWRNDLDQKQLDDAIELIVAATAARIAAAQSNKSEPEDKNFGTLFTGYAQKVAQMRRGTGDTFIVDADDDATANEDADDDETISTDNDDTENEEIIGDIAWPVPVDLWGQLDPPPLPLGLLPPIIEELALSESAHMGCDPAGIAISALVVCASVISDEVKLQVKKHHESWTECARLWAYLVGPPSTKKTPIINRTVWPVKDIDRELHQIYVKEMAAYDALSKEDQALQQPPRQRRARIEDTTIEAAQQVFADNPEGLLCLQDELSGFFGSMDRYSGGSKDRSFWLVAYNGGPYVVNRIKRGSLYIQNLSSCLLGGVQPDIIRKLAGDGLDDGLMQRGMSAILRPATLGTDEPHDGVNIRYGNMVKLLHGMDTPNQPLQFSAAAQVIRRELEAKHIKLQSCELISKKLAEVIGKYDGLFVRLCLTFQCIENMDADHFQMTVNEGTARRVADFLHQFLLGHACSFYLGMLGMSDNHERLSKVALHILAKHLVKIDNRTIQRGNRAMRGMSKKDTEDALDHFEAFGWLARVKDGKGRMVNIINPRVHTLFAERGKREAKRIIEAREIIAETVNQRRKK
jgi:hypothetical protein